MLQTDMWQSQNVSVPEQVLEFYDELEKRFDKQKNWTQMTEEEIWSELCLCILASNVPYELAKSSLVHLKNMGMLNDKWILKTLHAKQIIADELSKPIFLPKRRNGSYRKYRFPRVRARDIVGAAEVLYLDNEGIHQFISKSRSDEEVRNVLAGDIPGLGLKESSHFLRNVGYSSDLAIIDVHIISFLNQVGVLPSGRMTLTPKTYFEIEDIMRQIAHDYDLDLAIFDNAIWHYMRSFSDRNL